MKIISNHVKTIGIEYPKDAVVRINVAWIKTKEELINLILNIKQDLLIDYPTGRTKPPTPTISLEETLEIVNNYKYDYIRYFSVSNCENEQEIAKLRLKLISKVHLIPKIETKLGVEKLATLAILAHAEYIMLDKEDLYLNVDRDNNTFNEYVALAKNNCQSVLINCLELKGVIFSDE
jgi:pyruvate kinase